VFVKELNKVRSDEQPKGSHATFPGCRLNDNGLNLSNIQSFQTNLRRPVRLFHPLLNRETANLGQPKAEEEEEDVVGPSMSDAP
jgi:hypothetical protein